MSVSNNTSAHYRTIAQTCYTANIAYLLVRIFYLIVFAICKFYVLMWVDVGTIVLYLLCFLMIKNKKYYPYALLCGNEFFAFIIVTTLYLGFGSGFHFYLLGLSVVSFFASYFSKNKRIGGSILWGAISVSIYLTLYFVTKNRVPTYAVPAWLETTFFVLHIVLAFMFVCFYLFVFTKYTLSLEKKITFESRTDELTQINNRYALYDYFNQESHLRSMALALFDIDDFKIINDTYGHIAGDFILKRVAEIAAKTLNDGFVCRYGGEEFVVVLEKNRCYEKLEKFRKNIEKEVFEYEGHAHRITVTIGVHNYQKEMALEKWVKYADEKMYAGKKNGKNQVVL